MEAKDIHNLHKYLAALRALLDGYTTDVPSYDPDVVDAGVEFANGLQVYPLAQPDAEGNCYEVGAVVQTFAGTREVPPDYDYVVIGKAADLIGIAAVIAQDHLHCAIESLRDDEAAHVECRKCKGEGRYLTRPPDPQTEEECSECSGEGRVAFDHYDSYDSDYDSDAEVADYPSPWTEVRGYDE